MALETLIEQLERAPEVQRQVDGLVAAVRSGNLEQSEIDSLVGGLRKLRRESVGRAGRRLVGSLEGRLYMNMPALEFFKHCYDLRSRLVHGNYPRPTRDEVDFTAAHLEIFVGDLIAVKLLDLNCRRGWGGFARYRLGLLPSPIAYPMIRDGRIRRPPAPSHVSRYAVSSH